MSTDIDRFLDNMEARRHAEYRYAPRIRPEEPPKDVLTPDHDRWYHQPILDPFTVAVNNEAMEKCKAPFVKKRG